MCIVFIRPCSDSSVVRDAVDRDQDSVREQRVSFLVELEVHNIMCLNVAWMLMTKAGYVSPVCV